MKNWLTRAREISGLTAQQCADAIDLPISEYAQVERHPGTLTLNELAALACAMGSAGQALIEGARSSPFAHSSKANNPQAPSKLSKHSCSYDAQFIGAKPLHARHNPRS